MLYKNHVFKLHRQLMLLEVLEHFTHSSSKTALFSALLSTESDENTVYSPPVVTCGHLCHLPARNHLGLASFLVLELYSTQRGNERDVGVQRSTHLTWQLYPTPGWGAPWAAELTAPGSRAVPYIEDIVDVTRGKNSLTQFNQLHFAVFVKCQN